MFRPFPLSFLSTSLRRKPIRPLALMVALAAFAGPMAGQEKPAITVDDYGQWKRINSTAISPDGAWMSYGYDRIEGEDTLFVAELDGTERLVIPRGLAPAFSWDSRWVAYQISPPEREGRGGW